MQPLQMATQYTDAQISGDGRKGLSKAGFKALFTGFIMVMVILVIAAKITPTVHDDLNATNNMSAGESAGFRQIPGGELIADNATLVLLIVLLAVIVIKIADLM